jgi:hypothetical protein
MTVHLQCNILLWGTLPCCRSADSSMFMQIVWGNTEQNRGDSKIRVDMPLIIDGEFALQLATCL